MSQSLPRIADAERRARLAVRHHLTPASYAADVAAAARSLVGLHSTDPASVYLSAWARVGDVTSADIDDALYTSRGVLKHLAMRRTVWALATDLVPMVQVAASDAIAASERRRLARDLERSGITDDGSGWVARAERDAMKALGELGPSLGRELSRAVPLLQTKITVGTGDKAQQIGVVTRVCTILSASGQATRGTSGGAWYDRQPRWVGMQDWVPEVTEQPPLSPAAARGELARRWLAAFGPATFDDLKWWTGWTVAQTRQALAEIGAVEVDLGGSRPGLALADDLERTSAPDSWVALLPALDPTTMGWKDREWYLGAHRSRLFDSNGNAGPTIWADGRVVGGWAQRADGEVVLEFLEDVGAEAVALAAGRSRPPDDLARWSGRSAQLPHPAPARAVDLAHAGRKRSRNAERQRATRRRAYRVWTTGY